MRNIMVVILFFGALVSEMNPDTLACSCAIDRTLFLLPDSVIVPANIEGIPFLWDGGTLEEKRVNIQRYDREGLVTVPFDIKTTEYRHLGFRHRNYSMLSPRGGFIPGSRYRISVTFDRRRIISEVEVAEAFLTKENMEVVLITEDAFYGKIDVTSFGGGPCSQQFDASQVNVRIDVIAEVADLKQSLLYFWEVGGYGPWCPQKSLRRWVPPGQSWTGRYTNLFYSICEDKPDNVYRGLHVGENTIRVTAWLPGTDLEWTTEIAVNLECHTGGSD